VNRLHEDKIKMLKEAYETSLSVRVTAARCGVQKNTVERYWRMWKSEDFGGEMACPVQGKTKLAWAREARRRKISVRELHSDIIETIAEDNLFEAISE
jgi:transposase-like protein